MVKRQSVIAEMVVRQLDVAVSAAPGSGGQAVMDSQSSSSVTVTNTSNGASLEYKVGAASWNKLQPNDGIELVIDLALTALMFRRARYDGGLVSVQLAISGKPVLKLSESGLPISSSGSSATAPGQPAKPVLTAMAGAVSLAWAPGAAGSTATTGNIWTDINGNVTQLTTNPQTITAPAGMPYSGTVTTLNAQGAGPASVQADVVTPAAAALISNGAIVPGTSTANGFMSQATTRDSKRLQTIIRNQTPFTLVTAEQTSDNLTVNQPPVSSYVDLPPNTQNRIEGNGSKMWVGVKAIAPSSVSSSGTLCTIVFSAPHAMLTGDILSLIDFVPTGYNGQLYSVSVVNATTLTVNLAASAGAVTTMGKAFPRPITGLTIQTTTTP